jgi:ribosomal protein L11 methyltransferase
MCADIDPVAERVVHGNLQMNGIEPVRCNVRIGDILADEALRRELGDGYDVLAANIVAGVVVALCPYAANFIKPGGLFLCSGIIDEREEEVCRALTGAGFGLLTTLRSADEAPMVRYPAGGSFIA